MNLPELKLATPMSVEDLEAAREEYSDLDDDIMTVEDWKQAVMEGSFIDYDGYGQIVIGETKTGKNISPSEILTLPPEATHIIWYNR